MTSNQQQYNDSDAHTHLVLCRHLRQQLCFDSAWLGSFCVSVWITELIAADYHTLIVTLLNLKWVCVSVFPPNFFFFFFFFKTQHSEVTLMSQLCQNRKITIIERCSQTVGTLSLPHVSSSGSSFAFCPQDKKCNNFFHIFWPLK